MTHVQILFILLIISANRHSQIDIVQELLYEEADTLVTYIISDNDLIDEGGVGVNQIWDFSNFTKNDDGVIMESGVYTHPENLEGEAGQVAFWIDYYTNMARKTYDSDGDPDHIDYLYISEEGVQDCGFYYYSTSSPRYENVTCESYFYKFPMRIGESFQDFRSNESYSLIFGEWKESTSPSTNSTKTFEGIGTLITDAGTFNN